MGAGPGCKRDSGWSPGLPYAEGWSGVSQARWSETDGPTRLVYLAMAGLCLLPLVSSASLSAWELVQLTVVLAAVSCLGRQEWHAGRLAEAQPLVYLFIVAQFCREASSVVWLVTWVIVGGGLLAAAQHSFHQRIKVWESRYFRLALIATVTTLVALQGLQFAHVVAPWREWSLSRDLLVIPVAIGAYVLGRTGIRLGSVTYAVWGMRVCTVVFGAVLLHGVWQIRVVHSLRAEAEESLRSGAYEAAIDNYMTALSLNTSTVNLGAFGLQKTLERVAANPTVGVAARAYVGARILGVKAHSYEEWAQTLSMYRSALGDASSVSPAWRRNCRQGIGLALMRLREWGALVGNGEDSIREEPELLSGWVQKCVALMKQARYQEAQTSFYHVVEALAASGGTPADTSRMAGMWTIEELVGLLPDSCKPFTDVLSYREVVGLLENTGLLVLVEGQRVGSTDVPVPVPLHVLSSGYGSGQADVLVNGAEVDGWDPRSRGYSLVALDPENGSVERWSSFDTHLDPASARQMLDWVQGVRDGHIIVATIYDEATERLGRDGLRALRMFGSSMRPRGKYRWAHAAVGVKGWPPGSAAETLDPKQAMLSLVAGNMPEKVRGLSGRKLLAGLEDISSAAGKKLIYISGVGKDDEVILVDGGSSLLGIEH